MIRVLVIEHHTLARDGLCMLINRAPDMRVSYAAATLVPALSHTSAARSDVALIDIDGPDIEVDAVAERLRDRLPDIRIVVLSANWSDEIIALCLACEVHGYLLKDESFTAVGNAIRRVFVGEYSYSRRVRARLTKGDGCSQLKTAKTRYTLLTQRERELLRLLAAGQTLKRACESLGISYKTADKHKVNLMKKLDIHDRVELARYAIREGIIEA